MCTKKMSSNGLIQVEYTDAEYVFRVVAGNQIGSSQPSQESDPVFTARSIVGPQFSLEPFHEHYTLLNIFAR